MTDVARYRRRLIPLLVMAYVTAVALLGSPHFIENDDVGIMDFVVQGYPVPYMGIPFTGLLHGLYLLAPAIPWFPLALYAALALSLALWLTLLWQAFRPAWLAGLLSAAVCIFYLPLLVQIDYTACSAMLCLSSLSAAYLAALQRREGPLRYLALGGVFLFGMWMRPQGLLGALAFTLPASLWVAVLCLQGRVFRSEARRLALMALLFFAPAAADLCLDSAWRAVTATPQQVSYDAFNSVRGRFQRINRGRKYALVNHHELLGSIGWDARDLQRLLNWTVLDERIYTPLALETLMDGMPPRQFRWQGLAAALAPRLDPANPYLLLLCAPLPLLSLALRRRPWPDGLGLLLPAYALAVVCTMVMLFAFLYRVEYPYLTGVGFMSLLLAGAVTADQVGDPRLRVLLGGLGAVLMLAGATEVFWLQRDENALHLQQLQDVQGRLQVLDAEHPGAVILVQSGYGLPLEQLDPLHEPALGFRPIQLGWTTFSPRFYQQLAVLGVDHGYQLMDALVDRPGAYALGLPSWGSELMSYLGNGHREVQMDRVRCFGDGVCLMRFVTGPR